MWDGYSMSDPKPLRVAIVGLFGFNSSKVSGAATFLRRFIEALSDFPQLDLYVVGEKCNTLSWRPKGVHIYCCWKEKTYFIDIPICLAYLKPDIIYIHHEHFLYGKKYIHAILFPFMLILSKFLLTKAKIMVNLSGIVTQYDDISRTERLPPVISTIAGGVTFIIEKLIIKLANIVSVNNLLAKYIILNHYKTPIDKVYLLPIGINYSEIKLNKEDARKRLGLSHYDYILLFFGYLSYYKGLENLIEAYKMLSKTLRKRSILLVAGGLHPRLVKNKSYIHWVKKLIANAKAIDDGKIVFTGFVRDDDIPLYYYASDLIILPYKTYIASSGPLHLALEYGIPLIVSKYIIEDFILEIKDIAVVDSEPQAIVSRIEYLLKNEDELMRIKSFLIQARDKRNWKNIASDIVNFWSKINEARS
jgi:glycosyltransferase involved in cell wall biosynthesis